MINLIPGISRNPALYSTKLHWLTAMNSFSDSQSCQPHGGGNFAHLAIGTEVDNVVIARKPEVFHQADLVRQFVIIGDNGTAFERVEELGGVEAEDLGLAEIADHPSLVAERQRHAPHRTSVSNGVVGDFG